MIIAFRKVSLTVNIIYGWILDPLAALLPLVGLGGPDDSMAAITACRDAAAQQQRLQQRCLAAKT